MMQPCVWSPQEKSDKHPAAAAAKLDAHAASHDGA